MALTPSRKFIGVFLLGMLNLSMMVSLRSLPLIATYGLGAAAIFLTVAICFLFPTALISAELATGWTQPGGIYIWVKEAFGPFWGFFAVWMQWIHNITWFPAILSFSGATIAYVVAPDMASNRLYLTSFILLSFWIFTLLNFYPLKISSWFSALSVILGTILPGVILVILGSYWIFSGKSAQIVCSWDSLIPPIHSVEDLVFFTGLFLAFGGLEVSAVHVHDVQNPQKSLPRAIGLASASALFIYVLGSSAIAIMVPKEEISLVQGLMDTFSKLLAELEMSWALPFLACAIVLGSIGELNAWIIGPVRSLYATAQYGALPSAFQRVNQHGNPQMLLVFQAVIVTITSLIFLYMPSASSAFWILSVLSAQLYLVMYILMFLAAIKLRYSHPHIQRSYRIPYQTPGIWMVGSLGIVSSSFAFCLGFIPPSQLEIGSLFFYEAFLSIGLIMMGLIPYLIYRQKKQRYLKTSSPLKNRENTGFI